MGRYPDHGTFVVSVVAFMAKPSAAKRRIRVKRLNGAVREISALQPGREWGSFGALTISRTLNDDHLFILCY